MDAVAKVKAGGLAAADVVEPLICARRKVAFQTALTLKALATKAIVKYEGWGVVGQRGNPFDVLPKVLKVCIFEEFEKQFCKEENELQPEQWRLAEMLLATNLITKVDFTLWRSAQNVHKLEKIVIQHCPCLRQLRKNWFYSHAEDAFPLESFNRDVLRLKHIRVLKMKGIFIDRHILQYASFTLNNLEELQFYIKYPDFVELDWQMLERFVHIKKLNIWVNTGRLVSNQKIMVKMVDLVLRLPSLEVLGFSPMDIRTFTREFDLRSGGKQLLIDELDFFDEWEFEVWPRSLGVESLTLDGPFTQKDVQLFCTIRSERLRVLELYEVNYLSCLNLLQALAANVTKLTLTLCAGDSHVHEPIQLHQLLLAAPKVTHFELYVDTAIFGSMAPLPPQLQASHFEFWKSFKACTFEDFFGDEMSFVDARQGSGALIKMFELYLLGSKELDTLNVTFPGLAHSVLATLQTNPELGKRIRHLSLLLPQHHREELLPVTLNLAFLVVLRSPLLEHLRIRGVGVPDLPQDTFQGLLELTQTVGVKFTTSHY